METVAYITENTLDCEDIAKIATNAGFEVAFAGIESTQIKIVRGYWEFNRVDTKNDVEWCESNVVRWLEELNIKTVIYIDYHTCTLVELGKLVSKIIKIAGGWIVIGGNFEKRHGFEDLEDFVKNHSTA